MDRFTCALLSARPGLPGDPELSKVGPGAARWESGKQNRRCGDRGGRRRGGREELPVPGVGAVARGSRQAAEGREDQ